jgi:16S rRNA (uracil1498-N3)-methyltransferase
MAFTRLFVNARLASGAELQLDRERARYLGRVLRLQSGDALHVFNGDDGEFAAHVVAIGKSTASIDIDAAVENTNESALKIHLVQGISRGERMDFVVQKATELGVKRITPVFTRHGVVKLDEKRALKRRDHWQGIAESACEQSGRIRPPLIDTPVDLNAWFGAGTQQTDVDLILRPDADTPLAAVKSPVTKACLLIGPEGGFSEKEYDDARVAGFAAVSLGPRILRTETAALTAIAVAQSHWGDLQAGA